VGREKHAEHGTLGLDLIHYHEFPFSSKMYLTQIMQCFIYSVKLCLFTFFYTCILLLDKALILNGDFIISKKKKKPNN